MAIPSLVGFGLSYGFDALSKATENKRAKKKARNSMTAVNKNEKELDKWYHKESNSDALDTHLKNDVLSLTEEKQERDRALGSNAVSAGLSPEAAITKAADSNKQYSEEIHKLASLGNSYKSKIDTIYSDNKEDLNDLKSDIMNSYS